MLGADEDMEFVKEIGRRLKRFRRQTRITQEELADRSQLSRNYIGNIERGEKIASLITIRRIVKGLEITLAQFFDGIDS